MGMGTFQGNKMVASEDLYQSQRFESPPTFSAKQLRRLERTRQPLETPAPIGGESATITTFFNATLDEVPMMCLIHGSESCRTLSDSDRFSGRME